MAGPADHYSAAISYGHHSTDASRLALLPALGAQGSYNAGSNCPGPMRSQCWGMIYNGLWTAGFVESGNSLLGINSANANIAAAKAYVGGLAMSAE